MKMTLVLFALLATIFLSCTEEAETVMPLHEFPAPVVRVDIPEKATAGETVAIEVYFLVKNGCGEFGSFEDSRSGNTITVKVYPHYREGFCTQAITTREANYTFTPEKAGTYTLRFWSGEDNYTSASVVVE